MDVTAAPLVMTSDPSYVSLDPLAGSQQGIQRWNLFAVLFTPLELLYSIVDIACISSLLFVVNIASYRHGPCRITVFRTDVRAPPPKTTSELYRGS